MTAISSTWVNLLAGLEVMLRLKNMMVETGGDCRDGNIFILRFRMKWNGSCLLGKQKKNKQEFVSLILLSYVYYPPSY